jgi:DNA polymerase I-like protein with 3'-5' exonuclease and polymerase domains
LALYAIDIETSGLDSFKDKILCIGVYNQEQSLVFKTPVEFAAWTHNNKDARFIMHSGTFDVNFLRRNQVDISSLWAYDTKTIASLILPRPPSLGLESLGIHFKLIEDKYKLDRDKINEKYSQEEIERYCLQDCKLTFELFKILLQKLVVQSRDYASWSFVEKWVIPATKLAADMEYFGALIDVTKILSVEQESRQAQDAARIKLEELTSEAQEAWHQKQVAELKSKYETMALSKHLGIEDDERRAKINKRYEDLFNKAAAKLEPFNFSSPKQLTWLLRDYYKLKITRGRDDKESTGVEVLSQLADTGAPIAAALLDYREHTKMMDACIPALRDNLSTDNTVHARFNVGGTRTGRLSSSGPNFQQLPRGPLRRCIIARPGYSMVSIDYAQIEVRIIAELSQEPELLRAFKEDLDPYSILCQKLFSFVPEVAACDVRELKKKFPAYRDCSKTAGLSILYGTGGGKLAETILKQLGLKLSVKACRGIIDNYRSSLPVLTAYKAQLEQDLQNRKIIHNLLHRPIMIEDNQDLYMKALNTMVQGSASDLVVYSQFKLVGPALQAIGIPYKPVALIHDEVLIELPEDQAEELIKTVIEPKMTTELQQELGLVVPLKVEYTIGKCWEK